MRKFALLSVTAAIAALLSGRAAADPIPEEYNYIIYVEGSRAGTCHVTARPTKDSWLLESAVKLDHGEYHLDLQCKSEFDKQKYTPIYFSYEGEKISNEVSGTVWVDGDSVVGDIVIDGNHFPSGKLLTSTTVFLENYAVEHQGMMLNVVDNAGGLYLRYDALMCSDFMTAPTVAVLESEVELPTRDRPRVCKKYQITMQNSTPYIAYLDLDDRIAVYMDFPGMSTEIFLEAAYGHDPGTKYQPPATIEQ